jgi:hypothetical protein
MHKYNGKYYFSYSTGDTHFICYAIGDNPYGPFTYQGRILNPVIGWTSHHSICEVEGKWYLFYHDSSLSKGVTHLRSIKVTEITYNDQSYSTLPVKITLNHQLNFAKLKDKPSFFKKLQTYKTYL